MISFCLPAEHHDRGLWIGAGREIEGGAIDDTESIYTQHVIIRVYHSTHKSTAMIMPDSLHIVSAPLIDGIGISFLIVGEASRMRVVYSGFHRT